MLIEQNTDVCSAGERETRDPARWQACRRKYFPGHRTHGGKPVIRLLLCPRWSGAVGGIWIARRSGDLPVM